MGHLSLFQLNSLIKKTLDSTLEPAYWVVAEIGEIRMNKGHCYLELVEKEDDLLFAKMKANIWSNTYRNICSLFETITGRSLQRGMKILTQVTVSFHEVYGISLNIKDIDASFTLGERARKRQQVIDQLKSDGIFEMNQELSAPLVPQRVGIISSPSAAGLEDFTTHLADNVSGFGFTLKLFPATMQGDKAKESVIAAMHQVFQVQENFDVLVIIRGGGAQVDLDCFDTYEMAAHVAQFPLPVYTGIGHERDETVVDLVAHTRLKTPTAVAQHLLSQMGAFSEKLCQIQSKLEKDIHSFLQTQNYHLGHLQHEIGTAAKELIHDQRSKLYLYRSSLQYISKNVCKTQLEKVKVLDAVVHRLPAQKLKTATINLRRLEKSIQYLNPEQVLLRGYTISRIDGKLLKYVKEIHPHDLLSTETVGLRITSTVDQLEKK